MKKLIIILLFIPFVLSGQNFTRTFCTRVGGNYLQDTDLVKIAKYDYIIMQRNNYYSLDGNSFGKIRNLNPNVKIFVYQMGVETSSHHDEYQTRALDDVARYRIDRGHSMGNIDEDNPEFFLLGTNGLRVPSPYDGNYFVVDLGNARWADYFVEATLTDITNQVWGEDGMFIDGMLVYLGPTNYQGGAEKYQSPHQSRYKDDYRNYVNRIVPGFAAANQLVGTNSGYTIQVEGAEAWRRLDTIPNPPHFMFDESVIATKYGMYQGEPVAVQFHNTTDLRRSLSILEDINNYNVVFMCGTNLGRGESGIDNYGQTVNYMEVFYYTLAAFHLGAKRNSLFSFVSKNYNRVDWFDEFDLIDLGQPVGRYEIEQAGGSTVYKRKFSKGYIYINPTATNASGVQLPENCYEITPDNLNNQKGGTAVSQFDIASHRGKFFLAVSRPDILVDDGNKILIDDNGKMLIIR